MKSFIQYLILALVGIALQSVLFRTVKPDIVIILVCFYTLISGFFRGVVFGATTGLILDSSSDFVIGPHILSKISVVFFVDLMRKKIFFWGPGLHFFMMVAVSIIDILIVRLCLEAFPGVSYAAGLPFNPVKQVIFTSFLSLLFYPFFMKEMDEERHKI